MNTLFAIDRVYILTEWPSTYWLFYAIATLALSFFIYHKVHLRVHSKKLIASFGLILFLVSIYPFIDFAISGTNWSGGASNREPNKVEFLHTALMAVFSAMIIMQLSAILLKKRKLHVLAGRLLLYVLMPAIFIELLFNSGLFFLTQKPRLLATVLAGVPEIETTIVIKFALAFSVAILTPAALAIYWLLIIKAPRKHHTIFATLFIIAASGPGFVRYFFHFLYNSSDCPMFLYDEISTLIQAIGFNLMGLFFCPLVALVYATRPINERKSTASLCFSFHFYLFHHIVSSIAAGVIGLPFSISCHNSIPNL